MNFKSYIFAILSVGCFSFNAFPQAPPFHWAHQIGGVNNDYVYDIITDNSGNLYTIGSFENTADFDPGIGTTNLTSQGADDAFIAKYNTLGNLIWVKQIGGNSYQYAENIKLDASGNIFVTGAFQGVTDFDTGPGTYTLTNTTLGENDAFILKLDANGNFVWVKVIKGQANVSIRDFELDALGNIYSCGSFGLNTDFDPGVTTFTLNPVGWLDIYILKLDANGDFGWVINMGAPAQNSSPTALNLDAANNVVVSGNFEGTVDFNPSIATNTLSSLGLADGFIAKYTSAGAYVFAKQIGGANTQNCRDLLVDPTGDIYVCGHYLGITDFDPSITNFTLTPVGLVDAFILKLDNNGNFIWVKNFGGAGNTSTILRTINCDLSGDVYSSGDFSNVIDVDPNLGIVNYTATSNSDIFTIKLNGNGNFIWASQFSGNSGGVTTNQYIDNLGIVYTVGLFADMMDFDHTANTYSLTSVASSYDGFINKMGPCNVPANPLNTTPINNENVCSGQSTTLSVVQNSANINWYASPTSTLIIATGSVIVTSNSLAVGNYTYFAQAATCTLSAKTAVSFSINTCTGLMNEVANSDLYKVFPNPTNGRLNIEVKNYNESIITVISIDGQIIESMKPSTNKCVIDLSSLKNGLYIIKIESLDSSLIQKIIKYD